jgi:uncharacterized membrane protein YfcA
MNPSSRNASLRHSTLIRKRRELKVQHDWKMLLFLFLLAVLGCLIGAYIGFNYPD